MNEGSLCNILNKTKSKLPRLPFVLIKNKILGKKYEFGLSLLSSQEQKKINLKYRNKNTTTNVLSFSLSKNSGEITIDPVKLKKDAHLFNMNYNQFFKYLVIHGMLHLKGYEHSSIMEKEEKKYLKIFS